MTDAEKTWLEAHPVITLGGGIFPPLEFFDETKGQPDGVGPDYAKLIGHMLGIKFKLVSGDWYDIQQMAKAKEIDGLPLIFKSKAFEKYLSFSETYISSPYVIFTREQDDLILDISGLSGKTIAVPRGFSVQKQLAGNFPEIRLALFDSDEQALQEVATGRVDAYIGSLTVASHIIQKRGFSDLRVAAPSPFGEQSLSMSNRKDWPELTSIINKALVSITEEEKTAIRNKYVALLSKRTLQLSGLT